MIANRDTAIAAARIARAMLLENRDQLMAICRDNGPHATLAAAALLYLGHTSQEHELRDALSAR